MCVCLCAYVRVFVCWEAGYCKENNRNKQNKTKTIYVITIEIQVITIYQRSL